ncbi:hypothetical protein XENOCAPTIV_017126 [Xenoophorus captivus]|uniref:Uncharacterized protein n=1 Tax=Xenoophorus captivus TaxID=1517983 RepID=A0ABV0QKI4_9TELE
MVVCPEEMESSCIAMSHLQEDDSPTWSPERRSLFHLILRPVHIFFCLPVKVFNQSSDFEACCLVLLLVVGFFCHILSLLGTKAATGHKKNNIENRWEQITKHKEVQIILHLC